MSRLLTRLGLAALAVALGVLVTPGTALAGSAHFVNDTVIATRVGDTLTVSGKEAGLGDEAQVHIVLTATALCINGGGNHPRAVNKADVTVEGDFPVQNGKAYFTLSVTAVFQPSCSPPMTVQYVDAAVADVTNGVFLALPGTF